jgi:3-methyladenine DNA glycosylase AlkD
MRRRTAITAPLYFTRYGTDADLAASFTIAAALASDPEPHVHNAVGILLKHASRRLPTTFRTFLDSYAPSMPRPALRLAVAALAPADRQLHLRPRS